MISTSFSLPPLLCSFSCPSSSHLHPPLSPPCPTGRYCSSGTAGALPGRRPPPARVATAGPARSARRRSTLQIVLSAAAHGSVIIPSLVWRRRSRRDARRGGRGACLREICEDHASTRIRSAALSGAQQTMCLTWFWPRRSS